VYDSRSGGHVLLRFLPVRFESCLNDVPRLRNAFNVFQGRELERERKRERERERERECVCVCERDIERQRERERIDSRVGE